MLIPTRIQLEAEVRTLVVLGDPHGDLAGVEQILAREDAPGVAWFCVGDVVGRADGPTCSRLALRLRDRGVHTVRGNHEEWISEAGRMELVDPPEADPMLSFDAADWLRELPSALEVFHAGRGRRIAAVVHSLRDPRWREVEATNAGDLADSLGGPDLVFVGHSHRPRFLLVARRSDLEVRHFDYLQEESISAQIPDRGTLVVDTGSVACPDPSGTHPGTWTREQRRRSGTYAWVDLERNLVELRGISKIG